MIFRLRDRFTNCDLDAVLQEHIFNPFPNALSCDRPKLKEAADDNLQLAIKGY